LIISRYNSIIQLLYHRLVGIELESTLPLTL